MSQAAMMRCATGMLKPTQPLKDKATACQHKHLCKDTAGKEDAIAHLPPDAEQQLIVTMAAELSVSAN